MTMSANPSMVSPSPWTTVAVRRGVHSSASCAQFALTTLGTTTSSGKAPAASAASSACAVLPRPGSSASRKVRWPSAAAATTWAWWCMSSRPRMPCQVSSGSGSGMQVASPPYSKARKSGVSSSHWPRRLVGRAPGRHRREVGREEGVGQLPGDDRLRDDASRRRRRVGRPSPARGSASASGSRPAARSMSFLSSTAEDETAAPSASSSSSEVSRAAVLARIVAMPSSRVITAVRSDSEIGRVRLDAGALLPQQDGDDLVCRPLRAGGPCRAGRRPRPAGRSWPGPG